jgi:uncharacterized RmlC-like cupin family protein
MSVVNRSLFFFGCFLYAKSRTWYARTVRFDVEMQPFFSICWPIGAAHGKLDCGGAHSKTVVHVQSESEENEKVALL